MKIKLSDINKNICKYYILNVDNQFTLGNNITIKQFFVSLNRRLKMIYSAFCVFGLLLALGLMYSAIEYKNIP